MKSADIPKGGPENTADSALLKDVDAVSAHVAARSNAFFSKLAEVTKNSGMGWESISHDSLGQVIKSNSPTSKQLFTGKDLCGIASFALYQALEKKTPPSEVSVDVISFLTKTNGGHCIVKVKGRKDLAYFDASYRAFKPRNAASIQKIGKGELDKFYEITPSDDDEPLQSLGGERHELIDQLLDARRVSRSDFHDLVATML